MPAPSRRLRRKRLPVDGITGFGPRPVRLRTALQSPLGSNQWRLNGSLLNVVDDVTRECLAAIPDTSISGRRVARELTALIERRGKPGMIVSDNVLCREVLAA